MGSRLEKNSSAVRKRIEGHAFSDEAGEEYEASEFGGFGDYFRRKKIKLQNLDSELRASAGENPQIFKGVVAHVSGYTQPPLHVLHKDLVQHGAGFLQYLDSKTLATHIIASSMPPKKAAEFKNYRIVHPAWVTDSIKAGKLLPWSDFRIIDEGPRQKTIKFGGDGMLSQTRSTQQSPSGYREQIQSSFYASQFRKPPDPPTSPDPSSLLMPLSTAKPASRMGSGNVQDTDGMYLDLPPLPQQTLDVSSAGTTPSKSFPEDSSERQPLDDPEQQVHALEPSAPAGHESHQSPSKTRAITSEEHNAMLLSDPNIRKSTTANPNFLKQFYSESRLHHLATWKAELKSKLQKMAAERGPVLTVIKRKPGSRRYIMHVDFDSFFCAVSLKKAPEYVDKPAVVAHGSGNGTEIASCNYPARKYGVKNGMWMKRALELCPDIKVLPYDFPGYEEASELFYRAILDVGGVVQSVSIDEALVDITALVLSASSSDGAGTKEGSIWREQEAADTIATSLRAQIKDKTGCHVSVGIGGSILLAKVALRKAKPAGQYHIKPEEVLDLLSELKVEDLPSVAHSIGGKLEEIGVKLVKDIRQVSRERLVSVLGPKTGEKLWEYARGIDRVEVGEQPIRKSVSAEVNWGIRFISQEEAEEFVRNLSKELERRLLHEGVKGKHLTMKIMRRSMDAPLDPPKHLGHGKCDTFNKSAVFGVATNSGEQIGREAVTILRSYKFSPGDLRGLGVQLTKLEPLKAHATAPEGSQKKLHFGTFHPGLPAKISTAEAIEDDGSPEKAKQTRPNADQDPIADDPLTPRKQPKVHPALALAKASEADEKARSPLNMTGTQFIMPANPDPAVLAELPHDIYSKLMNQGQPKSAPASQDELYAAVSMPQTHVLGDDIPSDVDPEVFHALPDDMKAEILESYRQRRSQSLPRQSPRRDRAASHGISKKPSTPTKRGGIKGLFGRVRERQHDTKAGLQQTSLVAGAVHDTFDDSLGGTPEELDPAFLAELPEEMRREVIADHQQRRLAQRPGLNFQAHGNRRHDVDPAAPAGQTQIQFPARPPKIAFTQAALTAAADVREMLGVWHRETRVEGPHRADVEVFEKYLTRVVVEERDMDKARRLVAWLEWVVEEEAADGEGDGGDGGDGDGKGQRRWRSAVASIKRATQEATRSRGLGPMDFG